MTKGISEYTFQKRFGVSIDSVYGKQLSLLTEQKLLQKKKQRYYLTNRGIDLSNTVFCAFI